MCDKDKNHGYSGLIFYTCYGCGKVFQEWEVVSYFVHAENCGKKEDQKGV